MSWVEWGSDFCERQGLKLELSQGTEAWRNAVENFDFFRVPCFEPSQIGRDKTIAVSILLRQAGESIACSTGRLIETDSLLEEFSSGRLFGLATRPENRTQVRTSVTDSWGRIGYSGGTFIRDEFKGQRLGLLLTRIFRSYADKQWSVAVHAGIVFNPKRSGMVPYHYERIDHLSNTVPLGPYSLGAICLLRSTAAFNREQEDRDSRTLDRTVLGALKP